MVALFGVDNTYACRYNVFEKKAGVAQLVEYKLPKLDVAGSNPVARSNYYFHHGIFQEGILQVDPT